MATGHIAEDDLELYAPDWLPELDAALVEEHLLVCEECRKRLAEWDEYVGATRADYAVLSCRCCPARLSTFAARQK